MYRITTPFLPSTDVTVTVGRYANGVPALRLFDAATGEVVATPTVNLVDDPPGEGLTWIADYSENEGMPTALRDAGIVRLTGRTATFGHDCTAREAAVLVTGGRS